MRFVLPNDAKNHFKDAIEISFYYSLGKSSEKSPLPPVCVYASCGARTQKGVSVQKQFCSFFDAVRHQMDSSVSEV